MSCITNEAMLYHTALEDPDNYECEDVPLRDEYGDLVKDKRGMEIHKCTFVGEETKGDEWVTTAIIISSLLIFVSIVCVICYCKGTGKCCFSNKKILKIIELKKRLEA